MSTTLWKVQINNVSLLTTYLSSESTTACTFMAWNPFLHIKLGSSSLAIPFIGIRVPSMAPTTLGKFAVEPIFNLSQLLVGRRKHNVFHVHANCIANITNYSWCGWNRYAMNITNLWKVVPFCQQSQCCHNLQKVHIQDKEDSKQTNKQTQGLDSII